MNTFMLTRVFRILHYNEMNEMQEKYIEYN